MNWVESIKTTDAAEKETIGEIKEIKQKIESQLDKISRYYSALEEAFKVQVKLENIKPVIITGPEHRRVDGPTAYSGLKMEYRIVETGRDEVKSSEFRPEDEEFMRKYGGARVENFLKEK